MSEDYIFRYKLDLESPGREVYHHRPTELVRAILANLLNIIVPLKAGEEVKINGFRWLMDKEKSYQVFPEVNSSSPLNPAGSRNTESERQGLKVAFYEPRIELIKKLIEQLLSLVELEKEGQVVEVDSFRLENLQDWIVPGSSNPIEILEHAASHCNCDCIFCYNKGTPPSIAPSNDLERTAKEEFEEVRTRIKYFSPEVGSTLFPNLGNIYEVMAHPYFMDMLYLLREKTSKPLRITTNGRNLTPEMMPKLAELKPIYLYLSLNSSSALRRQKLMRDPEPEIAITALPLLRQQGIPYAVVIVPWPVENIEEMLADLSSTVAYAAKHEAHLVQINLPGYSNYFSSEKLFDLDQVWKAIISQVRELREKYDTPIVAMPTMYEENIYELRNNLPQIIGIVKNSPAHFSGLKKGDIILQINGLSIRNRPQACDLLCTVQQGKVREISLTVQRDSQICEVNLDPNRYSYPYSKDIDTHLGIIFLGAGLRIGYIEQLKEIIQSHQAKRVLFLSSTLVKPIFEQCLTQLHLFGDSQLKIDIEIPKNNFFGGNIFMGDLLVVQDFVDCIQQYIAKRRYKPDLVVIPSSPFNLSGWGRDLAGRVYLDIERETGVAVELLDCATIFD